MFDKPTEFEGSGLARGTHCPLIADEKFCSNEELGMKVAASPQIYIGDALKWYSSHQSLVT